MPISIKPVSVVDPDVPYDQALPSINVSAIPQQDGTINICANITVRPCRVLKNGTLDVAPESMITSQSMVVVMETPGDHKSLKQKSAETVVGADTLVSAIIASVQDFLGG